jgi:hypothetical protein
MDAGKDRDFRASTRRPIAHNEGAASAKFAAVNALGRVFPGNRGSAGGKFTST